MKTFLCYKQSLAQPTLMCLICKYFRFHSNTLSNLLKIPVSNLRFCKTSKKAGTTHSLGLKFIIFASFCIF